MLSVKAPEQSFGKSVRMSKQIIPVLTILISRFCTCFERSETRQPSIVSLNPIRGDAALVSPEAPEAGKAADSGCFWQNTPPHDLKGRTLRGALVSAVLARLL